MSKKKSTTHSTNEPTEKWSVTPTNPSAPPAAARTAVALCVPPLGALILSNVLVNLTGAGAGTLGALSFYLGLIGLISFYMGGTWYGRRGMAMRGGRPFWAGAGFAFLGWVALLLLRLTTDSQGLLEEPLFPSFVYLLLFEAFAVQLWTFGLVFRSVADWRGPLTAAIVSGLAFAYISFSSYQESYEPTLLAMLYFGAWGIFYGLIRLRTGSILGMILVQAMQSLTAWYILIPDLPPQTGEFNILYTGMGIWYAILIWRLWPKQESDYRV